MSAARLIREIIAELKEHRETLDTEHQMLIACKASIETQEKYAIAIHFHEWKDPLIWDAVNHMSDARRNLDQALEFVEAASKQVDQYVTLLTSLLGGAS